jgi:hypothetical protein
MVAGALEANLIDTRAPLFFGFLAAKSICARHFSEISTKGESL